ncbi:cell division protein FtsA [Candidatus Giovannonibacteria bacterium RIFCSPLOWO2_02_FULL_43_11b]|uniref:Cell division protein FtsA n=1 Tax=Candidatus Giovannonibacteria bacterium RIFCSPHIGHO2_12_FULL_43_15 TaxID=1798341 RepID=A0A1F5WQR6_9BACT|nr:MAG: cell division protein FtsA [Candidatus Giovannonibacteria bacterium RIFCSPHIGHO2_02_FULL_43_32]OGF77944.1 MAG: cell division protein FtsA [Candidatus Giovannonibacteria bacterium RIFCSPHIGHO2_12_FULL_43_15]OGF78290.1 MAG: cell division protein FtsA [Candidatus Giovannonibacteria bacterium RIFCSPLOWO2_01_FULL_43_60]OGF90288.1 MAG: cell division protein FtsA [Candidatus Giovannonibacteria bacterium RIFCSPLOWO2_02_FULL_43_11b]
MPRNIVNILDIGSKSIKALAMERKLDAGIHILGAALVPTEGVRRGMANNPDLLTKKIKMAITEVERFSGIPFKEAFLTFGTPALGASKVRARVAVAQASGEIGTYDIERVVAQARPSSRDLQNREILDTFGLNYSVDSEMVMRDPLGMKGENLEAEILFVTSLLKPLREMISVVEEAGVVINDVIPAPLASARAILTPRQREAGAVALDIGAETIDLAVMEENLPYSVAVFPLGGAHITNDIALGFQVSLDSAEEIKTTTKLPEESSKARNKFKNIVEARLEDMFELVENHLKKIGRQGLLPGGVVLAGGSSKILGIDEFSKNILRLPSSKGRFADLDTGHRLQDPVWATAIGAALLVLDREDRSVKSIKSPSILRQKIFAWLRSLIP